jgi:RecA-family ATPase
VLLQLAISAATGRDFLTFPFQAPRTLKVVYVDYESKTKTLKTRYTAICEAMGLNESDRAPAVASLREALLTRGA